MQAPAVTKLDTKNFNEWIYKICDDDIIVHWV